MPNNIQPAATLAALTETALKLAAKGTLSGLTRDAIANAAGVSAGIVTKRFGTMQAMRRTIMREAVRREVLPVIAEGLAAGDRFAKAAPPGLKRKAMDSLT